MCLRGILGNTFKHREKHYYNPYIGYMQDFFCLEQAKLPEDNAMASSMIPEFHFLLFLSPTGFLLC